MKKVAPVLLACITIGISPGAEALEDFVGFSLNEVRSSLGAEHYSSTAVTTIISARPNSYYGWEVQGSILGGTGPYSASGEADFSVAGFLPLGSSGINLYGKAGWSATYASGGLYNSSLTYGAGGEYVYGKGLVRMGFQNFDVGDDPSLNARLIGITLMFKLE